MQKKTKAYESRRLSLPALSARRLGGLLLTLVFLATLLAALWLVFAREAQVELGLAQRWLLYGFCLLCGLIFVCTGALFCSASDAESREQGVTGVDLAARRALKQLEQELASDERLGRRSV
jgi:hypothetical protein